MIEILSGFTHKAVILPGFRNQCHHGERKIHAVHIKEFERVVEHGGIGAAGRNDRINLIPVRGKQS